MRTFALIIWLLISLSLLAQPKKSEREVQKKGIIYNREISGGLYLATNGWGFFIERGKILSIKQTRLLYFGFGELRDLRMRKQKAEYGFFGNAINNESPKDFYFGKQNNFYTVRVAMGSMRTLADKAEKNGVRVSLSYMGGISLGLLKPYYLNIAYQIESNDPRYDQYEVRSQKYSDDKEKFTDWFSIAGASEFRYGLDEIQPIPGLFLKSGLRFDWARSEEYVVALEAGAMADVYYRQVPIMIIDNKPYFLGAYLSFQFGKRKLK